MGGSIAADQKSCKCGSTKWAKKLEDGHQLPVCASCGSYPKYFRVRKYVPGDGKRGSAENFRYDGAGKRLTRVHQAISLLEGMNHEIQTGQFKPSRYLPTQGSALQRFDAYTERKYLPFYEARLAVGEITKNTLRIKRQLISNHLLPFFGSYQLSQINSMKIEEFYYSYRKTLGQRDMATAELKVILRMAFKHEIIERVPSFPRLQKSSFRDPEMFLTVEQQNEVISHIDNLKHRVMIELLAIYGMRPCEVRALKWGDIDFTEGEIHIKRHCTEGDKVIDGRKSNRDGHVVPLIERARRLLDSIEGERAHDEFIFKGERCQVVSERVLLRAWQRAIGKTTIPYVDLYSGTKHSKLSALLRDGASEAEIIALTGHTTVSMVKRYAQLNKKTKLEIAKRLLT